ncbi:MAG: DUF2480 family protein [Flavobacteriales bacterium]|nr:DUF2480 family protein [Flavobacteriales bacterium]
MDEIINKVDQSGLITLNLEDYYDSDKRVFIDLKEHLYEGVILRERDFRAFVKSNDWTQYRDCNIAIDITTDAIVPAWAFMLVASAVSAFAKTVVKGSLEDLNKHLYTIALQKINLTELQDKFVIVKGCSNVPVPESTYVELCALLQPVVKTLSYGEACSKVPLFKKR